MTINAENITASYTSGVILFQPITFRVESGTRCAITGKNGTGKSTLMKILAGLLSPASGSLHYTDAHGTALAPAQNMIGFAAPYLTLYEEFTPMELIALDADLRGIERTHRGEQLLNTWGLHHRRYSPVATFSTGMKQRMKFILAMHHAPELLLLDEPSATMDDDGIATLGAVLDNATAEGMTIVIATNEERDAALCSQRVPVLPAVRKPKTPSAPNTTAALSS